ncbi:MAG: hypothetical protein KJ922_03465 [Nanoarchaeota archaeon]|nr:hypothetical protein [Nanoarchaeota archaeon]
MKKEKGMALMVAIFVTVFLLLVSIALFTSSSKEAKFCRQSVTGIVSMAACEGGAERALWYIQQAMDVNPDWSPGTSTGTVLVGPDTVLLNGFGDYRNFVKNYGDKKYEYINYGVAFEGKNLENKERQSYQLYAIKMIKQDDPKTTAVEWMLYSAGASRLAAPDASTAKQISDLQILVRLGRTIPGNPQVPAIFDGAGSGGDTDNNIYTSPFTHIEDMIDGKSSIADIYTERNWKYVMDNGNGSRDGRTGFYPSSNIEIKLAPGISANGMDTDVSWNTLKNSDRLKITPDVNMDFLDIDFDNFNGKKPKGAKPDYTAQKLVDAKVWEEKDGYYTPTHSLMYIAGHSTAVKTSPSAPNVLNYVYKDIDGDGYTIIYIPPGKGFRFGTTATTKTMKIAVENGAHGILLSEGAFTSAGNSDFGNSNDAISNVGIDIRAELNSANGVNKAGGIALTGGIAPYGNQTLADFRLGVAYPSPETPGENNVYGAYGANSGSLVGSIWEDKDGKIISPASNWKPLWSNDVGVLDILSTNNIIVSNPNGGNKGEGCSRFRGYIYSKEKVILQADLAMRGALAGKHGVLTVNQWNNKLNNGNFIGYDKALLKENPLTRKGGDKLSIFGATGEGGAEIDHRQLQILAWNIKK